MNSSRIIGLTGNSGSGKTETANILAGLGCVIIDADKLSREILAHGEPAYNDVLALFGSNVKTASGLDRAKIAELIFSNEQLLKKHTEITHKHILAAMREKIEECVKNNVEIIVLDAPLLFEAGLQGICDEIWFFTADYDIKLKRIIERDGITPDMAEKRLAAQINQDEFIGLSDRVFYNNGDLLELREEITKAAFGV